MKKANTRKQCPQCGHWSGIRTKQCPSCGAGFVIRGIRYPDKNDTTQPVDDAVHQLVLRYGYHTVVDALERLRRYL